MFLYFHDFTTLQTSTSPRTPAIRYPSCVESGLAAYMSSHLSGREGTGGKKIKAVLGVWLRCCFPFRFVSFRFRLLRTSRPRMQQFAFPGAPPYSTLYKCIPGPVPYRTVPPRPASRLVLRLMCFSFRVRDFLSIAWCFFCGAGGREGIERALFAPDYLPSLLTQPSGNYLCSTLPTPVYATHLAQATTARQLFGRVAGGCTTLESYWWRGRGVECGCEMAWRPLR
ncbi:hypothetical protein P171DRAFT_240664 [Karstenula rhodostoma CBS 690.94]|uniref:Uncharacterized protein n=1 Tax=Karstenula rhodostoma CBS 690.94 TaxID=1392251 RepID=A0A9P4UE84_9PLEO|nr:hypothetical protein P171DRAFT_240664 [Karstenula rhodostoma CBS 690.94]